MENSGKNIEEVNGNIRSTTTLVVETRLIRLLQRGVDMINKETV